jgi:hypothetical protein
MGGGERCAPFGMAMSPKHGCAQRTGAHARPKPTSLSYIYLGYFVCMCVTICCGTLCYSFSFSNQTDQGDQMEGFEREG